jgi:phage-related protein
MANGPGGVEEGRVSLRVVPDTSKFAADLKADMLRLRREISLQVPVELDTRGLAEKAKAAVAEANAVAGNVHVKVDVDRTALSRIARTLNGFARDIATGIAGILRGATFAGLGLSAAAAVPHILALSGSLAGLIGIVGLLPAAFAAVVTPLAALVIGMQGFGTAIKDIGDPKKFAQDLKSLAPAAQQVAKVFKDLVPQFKALQRQVQQHLFAGLAPDIRQLATVLLPVLTKGFRAVADALNLIIHNSLMMLTSLTKAGIIGSIFTNIATSLELAAPAIADFLDALVRITQIGSTFLPGLAGSIQNAASAFRDFVDTPKGANEVKQFIQTGIDTFKALLDVLSAAGSAIAGIVRAAQAAGGGALATFAVTLGQIADVINGPAFQAGLTNVFAGLIQGASALNASLPAISQLLIAIAPLAADLARTIGTVLAAAIEAIAPALATLAPPLDALLKSLGPQLVKGFQQLAPLFQTLATTLAQNKPLLIGVAAAIAALVAPVTLGIAAIILLAAHFQQISDFFSSNVIPAFQAVVTFLQPVIDAFAALGQAIVGLGATVLPIFAAIFQIVATNWPQIETIVVQVFSTVRDIIVLVLTIIQREIQVVTFAIRVLWAIFGNAILAVIRNVFPAILTIIQGVLNVIQGVVRLFTDLIKGNWSKLGSDLVQIIKGAFQIIAGLFRGIGGIVLGIITGLGSTFIHAGESIISGIITGIKNGAGAIGSALKDEIDGAVSGLFKHLKINSPSKLFAEKIGEPISEGIAFGITTASPMIDQALVGSIDTGAVAGGVGGGAGSVGVNIENVTVKDVDEMARVIAEEQRDAAVVENLQAQLVG